MGMRVSTCTQTISLFAYILCIHFNNELALKTHGYACRMHYACMRVSEVRFVYTKKACKHFPKDDISAANKQNTQTQNGIVRNKT